MRRDGSMRWHCRKKRERCVPIPCWDLVIFLSCSDGAHHKRLPTRSMSKQTADDGMWNQIAHRLRDFTIIVFLWYRKQMPCGYFRQLISSRICLMHAHSGWRCAERDGMTTTTPTKCQDLFAYIYNSLDKWDEDKVRLAHTIQCMKNDAAASCGLFVH